MGSQRWHAWRPVCVYAYSVWNKLRAPQLAHRDGGGRVNTRELHRTMRSHSSHHTSPSSMLIPPKRCNMRRTMRAGLLRTMLIVLALVVFPSVGWVQSGDLEEAAQLNAQVMKLYAAGRFGEAIPLAKKALAIREKALGPEHPDTATSLNNLAALYWATGAYAQAEPLYKRALAIRERRWAPSIPTRPRASTISPRSTGPRAPMRRPSRSSSGRSPSGKGAGPRASRHGHEPQQSRRALQGQGAYAQAEPL